MRNARRRIQNSCAPFPIFMLRDIRTIDALMHQLAAMLYFPRMAPKKTTLKEIAEMLAHVIKHMATKDDLADLRREMAMKDDINRLDTKLTKFEEHEIDKRLQLEVRVSAIEKHLGLDKKTAA
jgi:hypothetical protein